MLQFQIVTIVFLHDQSELPNSIIRRILKSGTPPSMACYGDPDLYRPIAKFGI